MRVARLAIVLFTFALCGVVRAQDGPAPSDAPPKPVGIELANAPADESEALNRLMNSKSWPLRAFAVMRLERYDCEASSGRLLSMAGDTSWRVRSYAFACLARRGIVVPQDRLAEELDPRVLRTLLRGRYPLPLQSIDLRIERCEESMNLFEAMYALECLAAVEKYDDKAIRERMDALIDRIIFRMDRTQGGVFSPRLAAITSGPDSGRDYRWREWARKNGKKPGYEPAALVPARPEGTRLVERNKVAALDSERFVALEKYIASVSERPMDLAILIDCTASMSKEIADAQSGLDDLVDFLGSITKGVRIGLIGYRDRGDKWETRAWDFTSSLEEVRKNLWSLSAEGGGDEPESVYAAMKIAMTRFAWLPDATGASAPQPIRALVLVGDAPPHVGEGTMCVDLAKRGFAKGVRFYGIVARDAEKNLKPEDEEGAPPKPTRPAEDPPARSPKSPNPEDRKPGQVEPPRAPPPTMRKRPSHTWFPEIADAGGGRAEILKDQDSLVAEIAELTLADRFRDEFADFFEGFRLLCR
ncbi:MAG: hypothetical protein RLZZ116_1574 [Planctomycetota bacterium]|jgi:hypothetical protein